VKNFIGVMQGRLLPKYQGRYQAHPVGYWQDEFPIARSLGLNCIEFILDYNDAEDNPLLKTNGIDEIRAVIDRTGVNVNTICADYFMDAPLHSENNSTSDQSQKVLVKLLNNVSELGVSNVVIPCVDRSSLTSLDAIDVFVKKLTPILYIAEKTEINLSLETDLAPKPFVELLNRFSSEKITVNYDIGNSAALGYDPVEELSLYGDRVSDIHIKDRMLNGDSVILGDGNAKFDQFFNKLKELNYKGPFIMQSYRDEDGVEILKSQLDWVDKYIAQYI
jgi:sugar phosphate isomerase/epimerase